MIVRPKTISKRPELKTPLMDSADEDMRDLIGQLADQHGRGISVQNTHGGETAWRLDKSDPENPVPQFHIGGKWVGSAVEEVHVTKIVERVVVRVVESIKEGELWHNDLLGKQGGYRDGGGGQFYHVPQQEHADLVDALAQLGDLHTDQSPTFSGATLSGLTASRLLASDGDKALASADLASWVAGTANRVTVADDGDGTITLSAPQDLHTAASPTFAGVTLGNTGLHLLDTDDSHDLIIAPGSDLDADRTLTLTTGDSDRIVTLSGNPTLADWFDQDVKAAATPTFAGLGINDGATPDLVTYDVDLASSGTLLMQLYGEGGGSAGNRMDVYRKSASPEANNVLFDLMVYGQNDATPTKEKIAYGQLRNYIADETDGTEDGRWAFYVAAAGSEGTNILNIDADGLRDGAWKYMGHATKYLSFIIRYPATGDDYPLIQLPRAITITKVTRIIKGGTNVVGALDEWNAGASAVDAAVDGDWTVTTTEAEDTSFTNAGLHAGDWLGWRTTSVSGSVESLHITIEYTES